MLDECGLKVVSASIHSADTTQDGHLDTTSSVFRVVDVNSRQWSKDEAPPRPVDTASSEEPMLERVRQQIGERLSAMLAPGNYPLLTSRLAAGNWTPLKRERQPRARGDGTAPPEIALLDLAAVGKSLIEMQTAVAEMWRKFASVHTPQLLDGAAAASVSTDVWLDGFAKFQLFRLRLAAGLTEDGVTRRDLELGPSLGEGGFGVVRLARHVIVDGSWYAVKLIPRVTGSTPAETEQAHRIKMERDVLLKLSHQAREGGKASSDLFCRLVTSWEDDTHLYLVMPAALGGELFQVLEAFGRMDEGSLKFYVACIVLGLQHLHSLGVVYRDLKSSNILLTSYGYPMLADFGFATFATPDTPLYKPCGTPEFVAPEVANRQGYGTAIDWWSLGIVMVHSLTLTTPFTDPGGSTQLTLQNICDGKCTLEPSNHYSRFAGSATVSIIEALLQPDPAQRLGSHLLGAEVRVHPFFWGLSWDDLQDRKIKPPHETHCAEKARSLTSQMVRGS